MSLIKSYIVPHPPMIIKEIGKGNEEQVRKTIESYEKIAKEIKKLKPETIIITSPHTTMYSDWFHILSKEKLTGNFKEFGVDSISFEEENDLEFIETLNTITKEHNFPAQIIENKGNQMLDHGEMVPLYFIEKEYTNFKLVVIGLSGLPLVKHYELGMYIKEAIQKLDKKVVFLASGDLSHTLKEDGPYGYQEEGPLYEKEMIKIIEEADFQRLLKYRPEQLEKIGDCGHRSITILTGAIDKQDVNVKIYSHEDTTGVGYLVGSIEPLYLNSSRNYLEQELKEEKNRIQKIVEKEDDYLRLARNTINEYVKTGDVKQVHYPKSKHNGVFVTIYSHHQLRGCIGTVFQITNSIEEEIIENAIEAASNDPRFQPITEEELDYLEIHVDILSKRKEVKTIYDIDPKKYGLFVTAHGKTGVLLPNIEGIDDPEDQLRIALKKGNIDYNEPYIMEVFEVERHEVKEEM